MQARVFRLCLVILSTALLRGPIATHAATIHVPADQPTIQAGIAVAAPGDVVLVAPGTYFETIDFLGKAITVASSGGSQVTTIDGQASGTVVTFASGEDAASILRGFTLTGGAASGKGGGVVCLVASPTIADNVITGNTAAGGGGIYCAYGAPHIQGNTISCNAVHGGVAGGGGILCEGNASPTIEDNLVVHNTSVGALSPGGGIFCSGSQAVIRHNTISENTVLDNGGGIACFDHADVVIEGNTILDNDALSEGGGIILAGSSEGVIVGNLVLGNHGSRGGGIACFSPATMLVSGNTLVGNSTTLADGGAILCFASAPTIERNIIALSQGTYAIACRSGGFPTVSCNDLFDNQLGNQYCGHDAGGNFEADPLFCAPGMQDYSLHGDSPCLPGQHPHGADCGLIGAQGEGCGATAVAPATWGGIKGIYQPDRPSSDPRPQDAPNSL